MAIRLYSSTDTGSPGGINNVAGQFLGVMDVLVNGYSLGTVSSITRSGSTATLTFSAAHGLMARGNRITIAGCDQTEYNGEFLVTVPDTTSVTYTVTGTPASPATGTITATKAGCSWTKPYTGTNKAAYKQGTGSNGFYLRVDDTGTNSARVRGYETMSDVDTGTGDFPTTVQQAGSGLYMSKSNTSTARRWILIATETYFYFWCSYPGTDSQAVCYFFGDFPSYTTADAYNTLIAAGTGDGYSSHSVIHVTTALTGASNGNYAARTYLQTGTSITIGKSQDYIIAGASSTMGSTGETYPGKASGGLNQSVVYIHEPVAVTRRGIMPGIYAPGHNVPLANFDTFAGSGDLAGKSFMALLSYGTAPGQMIIQVE